MEVLKWNPNKVSLGVVGGGGRNLRDTGLPQQETAKEGHGVETNAQKRIIRSPENGREGLRGSEIFNFQTWNREKTLMSSTKTEAVVG